MTTALPPEPEEGLSAVDVAREPAFVDLVMDVLVEEAHRRLQESGELLVDPTPARDLSTEQRQTLCALRYAQQVARRPDDHGYSTALAVVCCTDGPSDPYNRAWVSARVRHLWLSLALSAHVG